MLYIQKQINFWPIEEVLPASYKTGTTLEEFEDGAYLLLNEEQEKYHNDYPEASPLGMLVHGTDTGTTADTGRTALACP